MAILTSTASASAKIRSIFTAAGWQVHDCALLNELDARSNDAVLSDLDAAVLECSLADNDAGLSFARRIRRLNTRARIVILAKESCEELAIQAVRLGAADYLKPPPDLGSLARLANEFEKHQAASQPLREMAIVGESAAMAGIKQFLPKVAAWDSNVLILGETGTGKEMVAEQIHRQGARHAKPFVCVNCSAIPDGLLESELFGFERGAFTGALAARDGKLAQAHQGTLFFDEIGDMSLVAQAKILRVIESKEVCRLGGNRPTRVDIRIIAATNRDLEAMMREERFRSDLYFRLNVARLELPPLRERRSDILPLIHHFLARYNRTFNAAVERFEGEALNAMLEYAWPGNVRELKNVIEIVFLNLQFRQNVVRQLPEQVLSTWRKLGDAPKDERERLLSVLLSTHWNVSEAARKLHWSRMTMYRRLAKYNISPERAAAPKSKAAGEGGAA